VTEQQVIRAVIELITIVVLTFALALVVLGVITIWLERKQRRLLGIALAAVGLAVGVGYAFLGSRFAHMLFGDLIVEVDLPALMAQAFIHTTGVLVGAGVAMGLFLWATGQFRQVSRTVVALVLTSATVALIATAVAVVLSGP
jgi:hypothetical protein